MDSSEIIEQARGFGQPAEVAAQRLGARGVAVLPEIIDALSNPWIGHGLLPCVLEKIYSEAPSDIVLQGLDEESFTVFQCALHAAAERPDDDVRNVLATKLTASEELSTRRAQIATFFGNLGDNSLLPRLRQVFQESANAERADDDRPMLAVEAVTALAKLGDFENGSYLVGLLADVYSPTRSAAARALRIAVGPGMTEALRTTTEDFAVEVRNVAVEALFLLRCPAAVDALLTAAESEDPTVARDAKIRINDILGADLATSAENADAIVNYWNGIKRDWQRNICYRLGEPFRISRLFEILESSEQRRSEVISEIVLTTGGRPTRDGHFSEREVAVISRQLNEVGVLYRWGHRVDISGL